MTPYAFVRRPSQLVSFVVEENGRPDINENWPSPVRSMMKDSFNADASLRPVSVHDFICRGRKGTEAAVLTRPCFFARHPDKKTHAWLNGIRDALVSLRGGRQTGLTSFAINRRRTQESNMQSMCDFSESISEHSWLSVGSGKPEKQQITS